MNKFDDIEAEVEKRINRYIHKYSSQSCHATTLFPMAKPSPATLVLSYMNIHIYFSSFSVDEAIDDDEDKEVLEVAIIENLNYYLLQLHSIYCDYT